MLPLSVYFVNFGVPQAEMEETDEPLHEDILVSHDGIANTICLIFYATKLQNEITGNDGAFKFERHLGRRQKPVGSPNVVKKTSKVVGLMVVFPSRKVGPSQGDPWIDRASAMGT